MTRVEKYRNALRHTASHLKTWISASELSEAAGISRQTSYEHLKALKGLKKAYGIVLEQKVDRVHDHGDKVVLFRITAGEVP